MGRLKAAPTYARWWVDGRRQLVPDLELVPVRIDREQVGLARHELSLLADRSAGAFDRLPGGVDLVGRHQPESKVGDASRPAGALRRLLEHEHVAGAGRLQLGEPLASLHFHGAADLLIEA